MKFLEVSLGETHPGVIMNPVRMRNPTFTLEPIFHRFHRRIPRQSKEKILKRHCGSKQAAAAAKVQASTETTSIAESPTASATGPLLEVTANPTI